MRIITGTAKGRKLKTPEGMDTRPTSDRVKESVFNIISDRIYGARVLDLFAGTGNLGLESISRGAEYCTFIENDRSAYRVLVENINSLKFDKSCDTYNQEAISALRMLKGKNLLYDIIFLDPPYGKQLIDKSINVIYQLGVLKPEGTVISEYDQNDVIPEQIGDIKVYRTVKYGRTKVSFWAKEENNE